MRYSDLFEMPIRQITNVGNFNNSHGFKHADDRRALTSEKLITKLKLKMAKAKYDFVLYFVNVPGAGKLNFAGLVTDWDNIQYGETLPQKAKDQILADREKGLQNDAITIVFVDNRSTDRMPMTPWIITHRIWHAFDPKVGAFNYQSELIKRLEHKLNLVAADILNNVYTVNMPYLLGGGYSSEKTPTFFRPGECGFREFKAFYQTIGSSRAAREGKLSFPTEIFPDFFVEYLWTGKIKFRPLPETLKIGRSLYKAIDPIALDQANLNLESEATKLVSAIENMLDATVDEVFIV